MGIKEELKKIYDEVEALNEWFIKVRKNDKFGLVSLSGEVLLKGIIYDEVGILANGNLIFTENGERYILEDKGNGKIEKVVL